MFFLSESAYTATGLTLVILLFFLLLYLNQRKKTIINETSLELQEAEAGYRLLFEQLPISLCVQDFSCVKHHVEELVTEGTTDLTSYFEMYPEGLRFFADNIKILDVNAETLRLYDAEDKSQLAYVSDMIPDGAEWIIKEEIVSLLETGQFEITINSHSLKGRELTLSLKAVIAEGYERSWSKIYVSVLDVTEQTKMQENMDSYEKQIQQSRRLEAIGSLAGGIAHDFNNILSPIMGRAELILFDKQLSDDIKKHCLRIIEGSKRARKLVQQILTFSREVHTATKPVALQDVVEEVVQLVQATLPGNIRLRHSIPSQLSLVMADATQLHQVVMNLVTNAIHAMEGQETGKLTITINETVLTIEDCFDDEITPGRYLLLAIADTGHGIEEEVLEKIFDPYFSTKPRDKGTGLGLSVAHGILRNYGGGITVTSKVGVGTLFKVYFPALAFKGSVEMQIEQQLPLAQRKEHILIVDDEPSVTEVTKHMLERLGYTVTVRVSPLEAIEAFRSLGAGIDLVITDLTMPQMSGLQLFTKLKKMRPDVPIIICTGFAEQFGDEQLLAIGASGFLNKPMLMEELAKTVHTALETV